jgi:hypothetical protein
MSNAGAASLAALVPARAAASRRNGAKSKGPKTPEGKARSARNALRHGLCAQRFVVLGDEDLAAFEALEAALMAELAPQGALQAVLARRIVAATWRLERWRGACVGDPPPASLLESLHQDLEIAIGVGERLL